MKNTGDFTGTSKIGINEAIENALHQAGEHTRFEVVETLGLQDLDQRHYQVILRTYED